MTDQTSDNKDELIAINEQNLRRVIGWVSVVDSKAKFIFSIILVVLGYLLIQIGPLAKTCEELFERKEVSPAIVLIFFLVGTLVGLAISFVYLIFIIYPKRKPYTGKSSYFFYESIAQMPAGDFQAKMSSITISEAIDGLSDQTYNIAKVVKKKFNQLSISVVLFLVSVAFFIVFLSAHQIIRRLY